MTDNIPELIRSATDAIVTADDNGRIVSWNPAAERTFGYSQAEVIGRPLTMLIPERFQAAPKPVPPTSERNDHGDARRLPQLSLLLGATP